MTARRLLDLRLLRRRRRPLANAQQLISSGWRFLLPLSASGWGSLTFELPTERSGHDDVGRITAAAAAVDAATGVDAVTATATAVNVH